MPVSPAEAGACFGDLASEAGLLVAVSGGPDSVALLALLADWARGPGRPVLRAATVDHGLRAEAAAEAEEVAALCAGLGVAHETLRWLSSKPASGIQDAARRARYDLLAAAALRHGCTAIVTAHTLDDQAETLLMRLAHGSGPGGLAGMQPRSRRGAVDLVRPLLGIEKARLVATAERRGLPFTHDPSNADPRFERVRWRSLLPLLAEEGLGPARLGLFAARMARQEEALSQRAAEVLSQRRCCSQDADELRLDFRRLAEERRRSSCACSRSPCRTSRRPGTATGGWSGWRPAAQACSRRCGAARPAGERSRAACSRSAQTGYSSCGAKGRAGVAFTLRHHNPATARVSLAFPLARRRAAPKLLVE